MFQDYLKSSPSLFIYFLSLPHLWKQIPSHLFPMYVILNWANFVLYVYVWITASFVFESHTVLPNSTVHYDVKKICIQLSCRHREIKYCKYDLKEEANCWVCVCVYVLMIILSKLILNIYVSINRLLNYSQRTFYVLNNGLIIGQSAKNNDCFIQPKIRHQHWYQY